MSLSPPARLALRSFAVVFPCVLVGFAVVDLIVGRYDDARDLRRNGALIADPFCGWVNRPGYTNEKTVISSLGLRSPEIPVDAPRDEVRILGVGPSNVFGGGKDFPPMSEIWSVYLEELLNAGLEGHWRVLNGGVNGYSLTQSCRRAIQLLDTLQPDLILVFSMPDVQAMVDRSTNQSWVRVGERLVSKDLAERWPAPLLPAVALVQSWLMSSALYVRNQVGLGAGGDLPLEAQSFVLSEHVENEQLRTEVERTFSEVAALRDAAERRGVEVRFVLVPFWKTYSDGRWNRWLAANLHRGCPPIGTPRREPCAVLGRRVAELGLDVWSIEDLVDTFTTDRLTTDGSHWTPLGHSLVARRLAGLMRDDAGLLEGLRARRAERPRE